MNKLIEKWATDRGLHTADPYKQVLKLGEEFGELCQGMAKNKPEQVKDSIGDMYVVLTILCLQLDLSIEDCIRQAYDEIKDRKGKMVNGVFVKEEDLKGCEDISELESAHRMMAARNERLQKENDELAEALRGILRYPPFEETNNGERFYEQMRATAREVLRKYGLEGKEE